MKLISFFLLAACLQVSARGYTQKVTMSAKDMPLEKVFSVIEHQTGYAFFYDFDIFKGSRNVTLTVKDMELTEVLKACLKDQPLDFQITNTTISIVKKKEAGNQETAFLINTPHPPFEFEGTVTDENGQPLSGATVKLKNGKVVALTDEKGNFKLKNLSDGVTVEISYTGYTAMELPINSKSPLNVSLKRATNKLDEVQVIAYGTSTQRLNTGNVTKVTSKEIEEQPVANPLAALEGRVPGLVVTQTTGVPGGGFTVQIRGKNSIDNGTDPFYIIDGVPYSSQLPGGLLNDQLQGGSPLNFINPYDIESIEVLKDADATAIYGSRAANGAILITTKKGKAGAMKFDLNIYSGFTKPAHDIKVLNTKQYLALRHEAFYNDSIADPLAGITPGPDDHDINGDWDTTRYTDWTKVLMNNPAHYTDAEATVSGGNSTTQYLIGAGYYRQTTGFPTLLPGDGADQKASAHFNINSISPNKRFKLSLTANYVADKNTVQQENASSDRLSLPPDAPALFNPDGSLNWAPVSPGLAGTWTNPFAVLLLKYRGNTSNLVGNATLSYKLLRGLEFRVSLGYTNTQTDEISITPTTAYDPGFNVTSGISQANALNSHSWIIEPQADYRLQLGRGMFTALVGASFHQSNNTGKNLYATGFISDALLENIQPSNITSVRSSSSQYKYQAVFARLNYNWQDKYIINLTARRDGTSRFGPGKQFADFGAIGTGWIFTRENFVQKNLTFLSFGKIRASYGSTGNDQVGDYSFVDLYNPTRYTYQGMQGLYPQNLFNPDLAWETTKKLEGGVELGFFKDRIIIQASFYRNRSSNELVQTPLSVVTGFPTIPSNLPALVQNVGKEFVINTINIKTKNFGWSSSINLTIARNKLISFPNLSSSSYSQTLIVGQPITVLRVYHFTGVNDTTGLYQFASVHGGNTYNPDVDNDRLILLARTPKFYGGIQNSFSYKGFSLDVFFQFIKQQGQKVFAAYGVMPGIMANQSSNVLNRWRAPGDQNLFQKATQNYGSDTYSAFSYAQASDYALGDASFIRLKNLAISWELPQGWKRKMHLENFRIYMQGQNLVTITNYDGIDPESQGYGSPLTRVWTAGFQITL